MKKVYGHFEAKAVEGSPKEIIIEGLANANIVDRGQERMNPYGAKMEDFKINPIMLFNHDKDYIIGKVIDMKSTDGGLWAKCQISNSKSEKVQYVRDLIQEGILKTFSIGFEPHGQPTQGEDGEKVFNEYSMLELSVVSIPMNQRSTFEVKALNTKSWKKKDYTEIRREVLEAKGAVVAASLHDYLAKMEKDSNDVVAEIAAAAGCSPEEVLEVLAGNAQPTEAILAAFAGAFGVDVAALKPEPKPEDAPKEEAFAEAKPEDKPKDPVPPVEGEEEKPEDEESKAADFSKCVEGKIPGYLSEGMSQDDAVAAAMNACKESMKDTGCNCEASAEDVKSYLEFADQVGRKEIDQVQATPSTAIQQSAPDDVTSGNPMYDLMKQQIVLLGVVAQKLDILTSKIAPAVQAPAVPEEPKALPVASEPVPEEDKPDDEKSLTVDGIKKLYENIDLTLKELGY